MGFTEKERNFSWWVLCWMHGECINVIDGKIFPCGLMHASRHFEKYFNVNLHRSNRDYLKLKEIDNWQQIGEFMTHGQPFCKNCNIKNWEKDIPWKTSKKKISEWL